MAALEALLAIKEAERATLVPKSAGEWEGGAPIAILAALAALPTNRSAIPSKLPIGPRLVSYRISFKSELLLEVLRVPCSSSFLMARLLVEEELRNPDCSWMVLYSGGCVEEDSVVSVGE